MSMFFKRIKDWARSITSFRTGDVIPVDGPSGTAKMAKDDLLRETTNTALVDNLAPKFDPTKPDDEGGYAYYAGTSVLYEGKNYVFSINHKSGPWNFSEVEQKPLSSVVGFGSVGEAVNAWLNDHPEATTTVQDGSLTEAKFSEILKLQAIKDHVTLEMFGASGDGETDDSYALEQALLTGKPVLLLGSYLVAGTFYVTSSIEGLGNKLIAKDHSLRLDISGSNLQINNLFFDGNHKNSMALMYFHECKNVSIKNCSLENIGGGTGTQVGAVLVKKNCSNLFFENCLIKDVVGGSGSVAYGIAIDQNVSNGVNEHITVQSCYFENISPADDADGVKVTGSISCDLNVNNCYFVGVEKRAMKFQALNCKSSGNTIIVKKPMFSAIDFQRGEGSSQDDVIILDWDGVSAINPNSGLMYRCFGVSGDNVFINNFKVIQKNATTANSHQTLIALTSLEGITSISNLKASGSSDGLAYILTVSSAITTVSKLSLDVNFVSNGGGGIIDVQPTSSVSNSYLKIKASGNYTIFFTHEAAMFVNSSFDILSKDYDINISKNYDASTIVKFRTTSSDAVIRGYDWSNNKAIYYQKNNNRNNHNTYSSASAQRNCKVGDIAILNNSSISDGKITYALICTEAGTSSQTGLFESLTHTL